MSTCPFDLHAHSWFSDGELSPGALVERAAANGLSHLALTDHDSIAGLKEAHDTAQRFPLTLIDGIEFSATWNQTTTLHVLGLNINPANRLFNYAIERNQTIRIERAQRMALELEKAGFPRVWEQTLRFAKSIECVTRTHFAQYLIAQGAASTTREVYRNYLLPGKPGFVEGSWIRLSDVIQAIHEADGIAVLAHPGRYDLSSNARKRLLEEFAALGGDGLEVMTPNHSVDQIRYYGDQCLRLGLAASSGSDFHSPKESKVDVGRISAPPAHITPVWVNWFFEPSPTSGSSTLSETTNN